MERGRIALIGGLALVIVVIWAMVAQVAIPVLGQAVTASMTPSTTPTMPLPTTVPAVTTAPTTTASIIEPSPDPTMATDTVATPDPTDVPPTPDAPTDPRLAYAEFLLRLDAARTEVADLNETIIAAAEAEDRTIVRSTAVDILQFADRERDWLLAHPPAACYADAHDAAGTMLEAYATVAERAIDWADADPGLETLDALADVVAAAGDARTALAGLAEQLEATTCAG